jgi:hypothetical protein
MWPAERRSEELEFATEYRSETVAKQVKKWMQKDKQSMQEQEISKLYRNYDVDPRSLQLKEPRYYFNAFSQQIFELLHFFNTKAYQNTSSLELLTNTIKSALEMYTFSYIDNHQEFFLQLRSLIFDLVSFDRMVKDGRHVNIDPIRAKLKSFTQLVHDNQSHTW